LAHLLSLGVSVVAFDFAGSGKSDGEFVSLGYYEQEDLQTVVHYLRSSGEVSAIALWGRSMGAATAIMYGSRDPTLSCMILDSAFTDLTGLAIEMVEKVKEQGFNVPNFVVSMTLRMIKSSIKSQAGFSIRRIAPIEHVNRCFIPAMFVAGDNDAFIDKRHSKRLYEMYAGDKNIVIVDGDHNSLRPRYMLQSACLFLQSCMQLSPSIELVIPMGTNLYLPPWLSSDDNTPRASFKSGSRQQHLQVQAQQSFRFFDSLDSGNSSSEDYTPEKIDYMPSELPDMNVRQKEIEDN
jgi:alpha/beta superfamily hydrolase